MRTRQQKKSLRYFELNASEMISEIARTRRPVAITVNGKTKGVLRDIRTYEEEQKTLQALLKRLR